MYSLLIVDNERIDREGIKLLIQKFNLPLAVTEAESGKQALAFLQNGEFDILLSDIKMPFMDGLELAQQARELKPHLKIIIFSAYGEFDYAKQAIHIGVAHYILKPIRMEEFLKVMDKVLAQCKAEEEARIHNEMLLQGYKKGLQYEKEKVLLDLLQGNEADSSQIKELDLHIVNKTIMLILFDFKERFFDTRGTEFELQVPAWFSSFAGLEYVNLNEYQSIVFVWLGESADLTALEQLGDRLKHEVTDTFMTIVCIVLSNPVNSREEIHTEYMNMEKKTENKFFYDRSVVLFSAGPDKAAQNHVAEAESYLAQIHRHIELREYGHADQAIERFFAMLQTDRKLPVTYIKFICTAIMQKLFKSTERHHELIPDMAENIYGAATLLEVKSILMQIVQQYGENAVQAAKSGGKLITEVLDVIHREYSNDISLEYVADQVYLSPSYLSHLFKKETGQSFMKYVTSYRFEKSLELLLNTNMKISDISREVGYNSHSYFCSIFKNYYGLSPAQYRERGSS
ncbi:response regulator [Paenibacillus sp. GCM10027626]|uniref:response regulator n=1 Tax=Paenibacillus sp. GCM10027626 TaxID=3273411 RepID=UPI00362845B7